MFLVVLNDFSDDEVQKLLGEIGVQISPVCQIFQPRNLLGFAGWVRRRQVVFGLQLANRLCVLEPFAQRVDKYRVKAINAFTMTFEDFRSACDVVSQWASLSV